MGRGRIGWLKLKSRFKGGAGVGEVKQKHNEKRENWMEKSIFGRCLSYKHEVSEVTT
jgi:hypothetical protein